MKKYWRILPAMMIISILCSSSGFVRYAKPAEAAYDGEFVVYVSPDGDDNGNGTLENMLKTPAGAQSYVRRSGVLGSRPVRVVFKPGTYYIDKGLVFEQADAGTKQNPVIWESEEKGAARFYGSTLLDNSLFETVTEKKILNRLPDSAHGKVVQLDLTKMGLDLEHTPPNNWNGGTEVQPHYDLIRNGKREMLSRWPNGTAQYVTWDKVIDPGSSKKGVFGAGLGPTIEFQNPRIERWTTAKHAWIKGHISNTYSVNTVSVESVDVEKSTIKMNSTPRYAIKDSSPRELQIFNLLEEIDCATEWYIDTDTDILYYYPPNEIDDNTQIELTMLNDDMLTFAKGVDMHMTVQGFDLSRTRRSIANIKSNYVTIDNCMITYTKGFFALEVTGDDFKITNNYFGFNDGSCLNIKTADTILAEDIPARNLCTNNYFTVCGFSRYIGGHAITLNGSCVDVKNNTVHNVEHGASITSGTARDCNIVMNEFYNFTKDITDAGGTYSGLSGGEINNQIAYNFIYDFQSRNKNLGDAVVAIYYDDGFSFGRAHHNILYGGSGWGIQIGGGDNNHAESNIILNMGRYPINADNRRETWATGWDMVNSINSDVKTALKKFPYYSKTQPFLNHYLQTEAHLAPYDNVIRNNMSDMPFDMINARMVKFGRVYDNWTVEDYSHFVDPENYDFRIKDDSVFASRIPELTESNFDLYSVGAPLEVTEHIDKSFNLLYPTDGGEFNSVSEVLVWEEANMADEYRVIVATDKEMKNIVKDVTAYYNSIAVEGLEEGKEYWWTVEAKNNSFKRKSSWKAVAPRKFICNDNYIESVNNILHKVENNKRVLEENDLAFFGKEQAEELKLVNKKAMNFYNETVRTGILSKEDHDSIINELNRALSAFEHSEKLNFVHLKNEFFSNPDAWILNGNTATVTDEGLNFVGSKNITLKEMPGISDVVQFRAKISYDEKNNSESSYVSFDLRRKKTDVVGWSDSTSVMFIIKKHKIELQIYPGLAIVETYDNIWETDDKWHDYAVGVVNKKDGARLILTIDGEIAVDYRYYGGILANPGYFAVLSRKANVTLAESQMNALETNPSVTNYFVNGTRYSENGIWADEGMTGVNDTLVRKSTDSSNTATWKIDFINGKKKVYFRKVVAADGDKKAKVEIKADKVKNQTGEETVASYTVDMSSGEDEWILLDEGLFSSGSLEINLSGSGSGKLYANAVRIEEMEE